MSLAVDANTRCPSCLSISSKIYIKGVTDLFYGMSGEWDLLECKNCGLIYLAPLIQESRIGGYYPENYTAYDAGREASAHPLTRFLKSAAILPYTLRFSQPGYSPLPFGNARMLDVGCGAGLRIREMSTLGWQCIGLDISMKAIESASGLNPTAGFAVGVIDDIDSSERFDLISMHHVLEHLYHPRQVIESCYRLLPPGGKLVVNVPNIASFEARLFGRKWKGLDIPRHLLHFKEPVLERFLLDAGFTIENKRTAMFASSISESFIMCLPAGLRSKLIHSRLGRLFYLTLVPLAAISYFLGNRGTLEIVAVRN